MLGDGSREGEGVLWREGGKGWMNIPSSQTCQTDTESSAKLDEGRVEWELLYQTIGDEDTDDEAVDTDDTCHNNGNDIYIAPMSAISVSN